jgi:hypothetical protein
MSDTVTANTAQMSQALLVLSFLLLALFPMLILDYPVQLHSVTLEFGHQSADEHELNLEDGRVQVWPVLRMPYSPWSGRSLLKILHFPKLSGRMHALELEASGRLLLDGRLVDRAGLGLYAEALATRYDGWIEFRPHPNARYEDFVEALAVLARTGFDRLSLDTGPIDLAAPAKRDATSASS